MVNDDIVNAITTHANNEGSGYNTWYCGIAAKPKERLFDEHNVPHGEGKAWWIIKDAGSEQNARDTEAHLLELGFDGGTRGGENPTWVYAYRKIPEVTHEST